MSAERLDLVASVSGTPKQRDHDTDGHPAGAELRVEVSHPVAVAGPKSWYGRLQAHRRTWMAIRGVREILLIVAVYSMYDMTRFLVAGKTAIATVHGQDVLRLEQRVGLAPEHWLNHLVTTHITLALSADYLYATLHYVVTPAVLIWMWRRHHSSYISARTVLMVGTILALVGYSLYPTAPPRLLHGFLDTMAKFGDDGWWGSAASAPRGLGGDTNQFAAMPSLHVGWAVWCGWMLLRYGRRRITRVLGVAYPILLTVVVMSTANHYLLDGVAGAGVMALGYGAVRLLAKAGFASLRPTAMIEPEPAAEPAPA